MSIAGNLRTTAIQKQKELRSVKEEAKEIIEAAPKVDETKALFDEIVSDCSVAAEFGDMSLSHYFSGYDNCGYKNPDYFPPVEKLQRMLIKEGFCVSIKKKNILHGDVHGYLGMDDFDCLPVNALAKARSINSKVVGVEYYLEIKW